MITLKRLKPDFLFVDAPSRRVDRCGFGCRGGMSSGAVLALFQRHQIGLAPCQRQNSLVVTGLEQDQPIVAIPQ